MEHYPNGLEKSRMENNIDDNSEKEETDFKIVTKIDKITKVVYPALYVIFNIVYWYQLKD